MIIIFLIVKNRKNYFDKCPFHKDSEPTLAVSSENIDIVVV